MLNPDRFKLGLFVLVSIFLILAGLFVHGLSSYFGDSYSFYTVFNESVQGLEIGSDVKYKGVKLGSVSKIELHEDNQIKVTMEIIPDESNGKKLADSLRSFKKGSAEKKYEAIRLQISKGLACNLQMSGITGMKFIELDHGSNNKNLFDLGIKDAAYIPSRKGLFEGTVMSLNEALSRIAQVDFKGVSDELKSSLAAFTKSIEDPKLDDVLKQASLALKDMSTLSTNINKGLESQEFNDVITDLDKVLKEVAQLASTFNGEIKAMELGRLSNSLDKTLNSASASAEQITTSLQSSEKEFNATMQSFRLTAEDVSKVRKDISLALKEFSASGGEVKGSVVTTLGNLNATLLSLEQLFELLERDPSSLLRGKSIQ